MPTDEPSHNPPNRALNASLWLVQGLLALTFVGGGIWKFATPISELAAIMPWMGEVDPSFLYMTAVVDLCGGVGILLPSLTRLWPNTTRVAAVGCAALQVSAIAFHGMRGELSDTPFNVFLIVLSLFVLWGRGKARIEARA